MIRYLILLTIAILFQSCGKSADDSSIPGKNDLTFSSEAQLFSLNEAIKKDPENAFYYYKRSKFYYEAFMYKEAMDDINTAIKYTDNVSAYYLLQGQVLLRQNRIGEAILSGKKAETLLCDDPELFVLLAKAYLIQNNVSASEIYFNKAKEVNPYHSDVFMLKALKDFSTKDTAAGIVNLKKAIDQNRKNYDASSFIIPIYFKREKYDSCLLYVLSARNFYPKDPVFVYYEGRVLETQKLIASAANAYMLSLEYNPSNVDANYALGMLYYRENIFSKAEKYLKNTLSLNSKNTNAGFCLAEMYENTERISDALSLYKNIISIDSFNTRANAGISRIYKSHPELRPSVSPSQIPSPSVSATPVDTVKRRRVARVRRDTSNAVQTPVTQ